MALGLVLAMAAAAPPLPAQRAPLADNYTRRVWQTADGLPENTVQAFAQTPDHYLWIGTSGGLVRFDGARFVVFDRQNTPAIRENSVFCLTVTRDGALWAGTEGGGLVRYAGGRFATFGAAQGLTDGFVRTVYQDGAGTVWVGTDAGLFRLVGERLERVDGRDGIPALAVHAIRQDAAGGLWVGGSQLVRIGLASAAGGERAIRCVVYPLAGDRSADRVKSILPTGDGAILVGTVAGLERLRPGGRRFRRLPGIASTVRALYEGRDHRVWLGTIGGGLLREQGAGFVRVATPRDPPSGTVLNVFEDDERNVWVGLQTGLLRLSRTALSTLPLAGARNADFETVYADPDGSLWVSGTHLYHLDPRTGRSVAVAPPLPGARVRCVFRDRAGRWWVGTEGYGAWVSWRTPEGRVTHRYSRRTGLVNDFVRAFLQRRDGSVWIGTDEGISRWRDGRLRNLTVRDGLCFFSIRALLEDRAGDVWIGTDRGLSHWHDGHFVHGPATAALRGAKVWTIHQDAAGGLWFGTRGSGLFRWRDGRLTRFTTAQGLASNSIYQLLEGPGGVFWMSGPNGIASVARHDLDRYARDPGFHPAVTLFGLSDGVEATQIYGGVQPAGCISSRGEIWFPSNMGPIRVRPDEDRLRGLPLPQAVIEQVLVDGRQAPAGGPLVVPPGQGHVQIDYGAIRLRSQESIRFRYRLVGFDRRWNEALRGRVAEYTNVPPGRYVFQVQAFEMNMPERVTQASLAMAWQPPLYRTGWFLALCAGLALLLLLAGYRLQLRLVRARFAAVLAERTRIAREIHDTVIQGAVSASALLEAVASLDGGEARPGAELLATARVQLRATVDEARDAVWDLRRGERGAAEIGPLVERTARHASQGADVAVRVETAGRPAPLAAALEHAILMVAREAVYNAVRHGRPREVRVRLEFASARLRLEVRDDGAGFDQGRAPGESEGHFGLAGMRERMRQLGGALEVISAPGRGTRVVARAPLRGPAAPAAPAP